MPEADRKKLTDRQRSFLLRCAENAYGEARPYGPELRTNLSALVADGLIEAVGYSTPYSYAITRAGREALRAA